MKRIEDEGNQAENIKVNGARRIPPPHKDEHSDEEIQKPDYAKVIFYGGGLLGRRSNQGRLKLFAVARQFIPHLGPKPCTPQTFGNLHLATDS